MRSRAFPRAAALLLAGVTALGAGCASRPAPVDVQPHRPSDASAARSVAFRRLSVVDTLVPADAATVGLDPALPARLDSIVEAGLAGGAAPGAVLAVGRYGRLVHLKGYGTLDRPRVSARPDARTLYDLASVTKVVATTTAAMMLEEDGRLDLSRPVHTYVPELDAPDKAAITVRMLLTHSG
ncbi:MAG TPA: serine hydrolase domain-containing protein, partial [Gemmatirosa sp.]